MKLLTIIGYTLIRNLKDIKMHLFLIIAPLVFLAILGASLDSVFLPRDINAIDVAYLNLDDGIIGTQFDEFLSHGDVQAFMSIHVVQTYDAAEEGLSLGHYESFIYVPEDMSNRLMRGEESEIFVYTGNRSSVVKVVVDQFVETTRAIFAINMIGGTLIEVPQNMIADGSVSIEGNMPRAIDHYSVQTLLMLMLMGALYGVSTVNEDDQNNTAVRIKCAPISQIQNLLGRGLANVIVLFLQAMIVIAFSSLVYKANWGGVFSFNMLVILIFSVLTVSLGMLLGLCFKNSTASMAVLWMIIFIISTSAGAFAPVESGSLVDRLSIISPNFYAGQAIFYNVFIEDLSLANKPLLALCIITLLVILAAAMASKRRLKCPY